MNSPSFLSEFLLVLTAATLVAVVFERFRFPPILGFLLAGVFIGPGGFGLVNNTERIRVMAEMGVVLLMLTIGLEFSIERLRGLRKIAFFGGGLQICLSILVSLLFAWNAGWTLYQGFFLGSVIALSSTAIVLKHLLDRGELDTQYGRVCLAILIFQDLAVPVLLIFIAGFNAEGGSLWITTFRAIGKACLFGLAVAGIGRYVLPKVLRQVALSRSREIFFLASVAICLGMAWAGEQFGLSLAIGAFLAGFLFANTDLGSRFISEIAPFRHVFVSIFFVSLGLLFDVRFALEHAASIAWMVGLVLLVNCGIVTVILIVLGFSPRVAMASGILLSQIGEFSFVLVEAARGYGGIDELLYQTLLSTAFVTMLASPLLFSLVPPMLNLFEWVPFLGVPPVSWASKKDELLELRNHIILCGYGTAGHDLALTFKGEQIPFVILDMNPLLIRKAKQQGFHVIYGDAANVGALKQAGVERARAVVISFADPIGMGQILRIIQHLNPHAFLAVRTRFEKEIARLYELGADTVVLEEWEASIQLNRVMLEYYEVDSQHIAKHLDRIRSRHEILTEELIMKKPSKPAR